MCFSMAPKLGSTPQAMMPDPNAAANAAAAAEIAKRRQAVGIGSTIGGVLDSAQPSVARKTLYGQ